MARMGRKRGKKGKWGKGQRAAKTRLEYPGGWREVLERHPLTSRGYALRPSNTDPKDLQAVREAKIAKAKDWFAPRGKRHP